MKITRDVILDLLPLYLAGEASDDTRALVEQYLADDPALARLVQKSTFAALGAEVPAPLNKEDEMKAFEKTKRLLFQQRLFMGLAIFATLGLLGFKIGPDGISWLWIDAPAVAWLLLFGAFVFWTAYLNVSWLLNKSEWD